MDCFKSPMPLVVVLALSLATLARGDDAGNVVTHHVAQVAILASPSLEDDSWFGRAAIDGDFAVVGAHGDDLEDLALVDAGSAHVYRRDGHSWSYLQMLTAPDAQEQQTFGHISAISDDTIVIGAPGIWWSRDIPGAAYVYVRDGNTWIFQQKLVAPENDVFHCGVSVTIDGDTIAFGCGIIDEPEGGRVYVFTRSGDAWTQQQVLEPTDGPDDGSFGGQVAVSEDSLLVSAQSADRSGFENCGAVYLYVRDNGVWNLEQMVIAPDAHDSQEFGWSADLDRDSLIVGAHWDHHDGFDNAGAAYIFVREAGMWSKQSKLTSKTPRDFDAFGWDVAISGDSAVVGTCGPYRSPDPITASLHVYTRTDGIWNLQRVIRGEDLGVTWIAWESDLRNDVIAMDGWDPDGQTGGVRVYTILPGPEKVVFPAVAKIQGAGALFASRWNLFNAGDEDMTIEMTYTPRRDLGGADVTVSYSLPAGTLREIVNPLSQVFGISDRAVGSVIMHVTDGSIFDLKTQSVVYARLEDGSEFGQFFPASLVSEGLMEGTVAHLCTTENADRNRVNVGIMAVDDGTSVAITPVDPAIGPLASSRIVDLDSGESVQLNNLDSVFGLSGRSNYLVEVAVEAGCALAYSSVLDGNGDYGGTSDPTTILPSIAGATQVVLLEIGPVQGLDEFSGSATIVNASSDPTHVRADFFQRGEEGVSASTTIDLEGGEVAGFGDVVGELFGLESAVGTMVLTTDPASRIASVGREFAIFRGEGGDVVGTAGQVMTGLTQTDIFHPAVNYYFIGLRSRETDSGIERSHVAIFNPGEDPIQAEFTVYGAGGGRQGSLTKTVGGEKLVHYNHILDLVDPDQNGDVKRLEVVLDGWAWVRAFRVNSTGDPITLEPFVGGTAN